MESKLKNEELAGLAAKFLIHFLPFNNSNFQRNMASFTEGFLSPLSPNFAQPRPEKDSINILIKWFIKRKLALNEDEKAIIKLAKENSLIREAVGCNQRSF